MGGAAGHMAHLHENTWLTFGEVKSFLTRVAVAELSPIEKVDGQNIFFRWTPAGIMCARNAGHLKKGGINESDYRAMWDGHPAEDAFIQGFETIKAALENLSEEAKTAFKTATPNSYRFCNTEIMYPENENLILYDGNYVVLHNLKEYTVVGGKLQETEVFMSGDSEFDAIVASLSAVEKSKDAKEWQIFGPKFVQLNNISDGSALEEVKNEINGLGFDDNATIFEMVANQLRPQLEATNMSSEKIEQMMLRIKLISEKADTKELPPIASIKAGLNAEQKELVTKYGSRAKAMAFIGSCLAPLAKPISDFAIEVLRGLESFFVSDSLGEIERIKEKLASSIEALESYDGADAAKMGELLEKQLEKLGPIENIASTLEGVIFEYPPGSKSLIKLTGSFAMANQIIGRAKRLPPKQSNESLYTNKDLDYIYEQISGSSAESVAVIGGAFKPPHLGHLQMVYHYLDRADRVKIYISNPKSKKSQRFCGNVCLTADMALRLWKLLLADVSGVDVEISSSPSPISVAYDSVMPGHPWAPGTTVYLGASLKGGDISRFANAASRAAGDITVADPAANAAPAAQLPNAYLKKLKASGYDKRLPSVKKNLDPADYHASDLRFLLMAATVDPVAKDLAGFYVGKKNVTAYMSAIGLLQESKKYNLKYRLFDFE